MHRTVLAGVWRVVAGSIVDGPVVGRFVVGEATFHGAGTSHGGTAFRGEAGFHGAPAGCCQITSWSGKGAGGSLSHDRHRLPRPSLSPDTHSTPRLAVPPVHLELPEMWRSFSDGTKERQETGACLRHRYLVSENPRCRRQKSVRIAIYALLVSFGRLIYYSLEISAHCGCCRTWHKGEISI